MNLDTMSIDARLRNAAALLMSLPATVAVACFAHGHGALGLSALLGVLAASIAAGGLGACLLLSLLRTPKARNVSAGTAQVRASIAS